MTITLNAIRYHTETSPYHYTEDNKPLQDLEQNDILLKAAVDSINANSLSALAAGSWPTLKAILDLSQDINHQFVYSIKIWAIQDQAVKAGQAATLMQYSVFGYNTNPGLVTVSGNTQVYRHSVGAGVLTPTFTGNANNLEISFSGYTGTNGYVLVKAERYGF